MLRISAGDMPWSIAFAHKPQRFIVFAFTFFYGSPVVHRYRINCGHATISAAGPRNSYFSVGCKLLKCRRRQFVSLYVFGNVTLFNFVQNCNSGSKTIISFQGSSGY
jgi:hypothetical protein